MEDVENAALGHTHSVAAHDRDYRIRRGLASVLLVCAHCSAYHVAGVTAKYLSGPLAIALLVLNAHALYLMIYVLGHYHFISEASTRA